MPRAALARYALFTMIAFFALQVRLPCRYAAAAAITRLL